MRSVPAGVTCRAGMTVRRPARSTRVRSRTSFAPCLALRRCVPSPYHAPLRWQLPHLQVAEATIVHRARAGAAGGRWRALVPSTHDRCRAGRCAHRCVRPARRLRARLFLLRHGELVLNGLDEGSFLCCECHRGTVPRERGFIPTQTIVPDGPRDGPAQPVLPLFLAGHAARAADRRGAGTAVVNVCLRIASQLTPPAGTPPVNHHQVRSTAFRRSTCRRSPTSKAASS
jgi:hypothetical protein